MRKYSALLAFALSAVVPVSLIACGDDKDDQPPGTGGTAGKGGSGGKASGGSAGKASGGSAGKASGGSAGKGSGGSGAQGGEAGETGQAGDGATGGTTAQGGSAGQGGEGATPSEGGMGGEPTQPPTCDLSGSDKQHQALPSSISEDFTATSDKVWDINGFVHVEAGATLTIEKCTRLEGSPAPSPGVLVATRGGRIVANGEKDEPILFTSAQATGREAGQWGGVVLLGRAPITRPGGATEALYEGLTDVIYTYGGNLAEDDSGSLRYVRIEFGGYEILPDKEVNGLSMAGVGTGTTIDHIMVSNTLDDCFEWWGGGVRADYLVCNNPGDDNFDGDDGWQGGGEYWFGRRAGFAVDSDDPNGFELDSHTDGTLPRTAITVANVTLCSTGAVSGRPSPLFGMVLRELFTGAFDNVDLLGFEYGIDTRNAIVAGDVTLANSKFWELVNAGALGSPDATDNDMGFDDASIFTSDASNTEPDPVPYTVADCLNGGNAPVKAVLDSDSGAFAGGADWMDGLWVDWSEE
jgi:hypothetical protein